MLAEVRALFWLQWRLTLAVFRSRRAQFWAQLGRFLLMLLLLISTVPWFAGMGAALAYGVAKVSPEAAFELIALTNAVLIFFWLLLPASYSSELVERFELRRLFVHPVSFRGLVLGSALVSFGSLTGVWTILMVSGEVVGLALHRWWKLPVVVMLSLPSTAILVFTGRLLDDFMDLVSADRRLRGILVFVLMSPLLLLVAGNWLVQILARDSAAIEALFQRLTGGIPPLEGLGFLQSVDVILTSLRLSRFVMWLPTTWGAAGMTFLLTDRYLQGVAMLLGATGVAGLLIWAHAAMTRRLAQGTVLRLGAERVRSRRWDGGLPGPPQFWALFAKDWAYLWRSPITKRVLLGTPMIAASFAFAAWQLGQALEGAGPARQTLALIGAVLVTASLNLAMANLSGNYFGAVDREGLGTLLLAPVDRRLVLLSSTLATLTLSLAESALLLALIAAASGLWWLLPAGVLLAACLHVGTAPAYTLAGIIGAQRDHMEVIGSRTQGNSWMLLAWAVAAPPVLAPAVIAYLLAPAALLLALPVTVAYCAGLYALTLRPLANLLEVRRAQVLEAVSRED